MAGEVLTGEVQQWAAGRWRTILTRGGIPVDDRRRVAADLGGRPAEELDDFFGELMGRYTRGWPG